MTIDNRYEEVVDGATNFQKREIVVSHQSRPTDKSNAHLKAAYRDTHRQVYQEDLPTRQKYAERHVNQVDQDSTEAAYREQR
jgi:hypothetical protein